MYKVKNVIESPTMKKDELLKENQMLKSEIAEIKNIVTSRFFHFVISLLFREAGLSLNFRVIRIESQPV